MPATDHYYTVAGAARILRVSPSTVWRWIAAGRLPAKRFGPKTIRIASEDLAALEHPAQGRRQEVSMSIDQLKKQLAVPPSAGEIIRREAVVARTIEHRKDLVIAPLTTPELIRQAREEEARSHAIDR